MGAIIYSKKILNKYNKLPVMIKASLWFVLCNILQKGISMITVPLFTRLLTTAEYGQFSVYQSWYSILSIFSTLYLFDAAYNTGMVKFKDDRDNFTISLQSLTSVLAIILLVVYLFDIDFWNKMLELPTVVILCMDLEFLFIPAYSFWSARQKFEYKYRNLVIFTLLISILCPVIALISIHYAADKGIARILSFTLVQTIFGIGFYILNAIRGGRLICIKYWKYALGFSIPLIPHYLSMTILQQSDRIMISKMVGTSEAAIYSIAYNISQIILLITKAINNSYIPYTYGCLEEKNYKKLRENTNYLLVLIGLLIFCVMLLGPELIKIFATPVYYDAVWIIPPVAVSVFLMFLYPIFSNIEFYYEKSSVAMSSSLVGAVLNLGLNYIFIKRYGYIAAGYTTLFCYMIFAIMHYYGMKKVLKQKNIKEPVYDLKFLLLVTIIMLIVMIGVLLIYPYTIIRILLLSISLTMCFVMRNRIISIMKNLKKKDRGLK